MIGEIGIMMKLTLPSYLVALVPEAERSRIGTPRSLSLDAMDWGELILEIRDRFPELAKRIFIESNQLAPGFVLVVNGEPIKHTHEIPDLHNADQVVVIAAIAGG